MLPLLIDSKLSLIPNARDTLHAIDGTHIAARIAHQCDRLQGFARLLSVCSYREMFHFTFFLLWYRLCESLHARKARASSDRRESSIFG